MSNLQIDYDSVAEIYDLYVTVDYDIPFFLSEAANAKGPVLELTAGTGRLSLPLARVGRNSVLAYCVAWEVWESTSFASLPDTSFAACNPHRRAPFTVRQALGKQLKGPGSDFRGDCGGERIDLPLCIPLDGLLCLPCPPESGHRPQPLCSKFL